MRAWAEQRLGHEAAAQIGSAAIEPRNGEPMDARAAEVLRELGGDPTGFRAHQLTTGETSAALVLTMNRWHRRKVLGRNPRALRRTFTLGEASALLALADTAGLGHLPLPDRARELAARLHAARPRRPDSGADDVRDPIGQPLEVHRQMADHIVTLLSPLADVLLASQQAAAPPRPGGDFVRGRR